MYTNYPMSDKVKVAVYLDPELNDFCEKNKGEELKKSQYIRTILRQEMKRKAKRKSSMDFKESNNDPFANPTINGRLIPDDLKDLSQLILEWWPIRYKNKATCSTSVAERIFKKLRTFTPKDRKIALEKAIAGGWRDIYEVKQSKVAEEPKNNHPASRVFTADKGFID